MKKLFSVPLFLLVLGCVLKADIRVSPKFAYFHPAEKTIRNDYGGGLTYGGEVNIGLGKFIEFWVGAMYFREKGKQISTDEETKISLFPVEGGLKFKLSPQTITPYFSAGIGYYLYEESKSGKKLKDNKLGYCVQLGLLITSCKKDCGLGVTIDVFVNYSYCTIKPQDSKLNIGGIRAGVGWGFVF